MRKDILDRYLMPVWNASRRYPWLALSIVLILQTAFALHSRALWFSDEVRYADVFQNLINHGKWIVLHLNGDFYPDKPPVYFWLLSLIHVFHKASDPALFFIGTAVSSVILLLALVFLAKSLKESDDTTLAAGFILLTTFYLVALFHYTRMDILFTALIIASEGCFFRAWREEGENRWTIAGYGLAGLATLTKGPLGLIFPLLANAVYLARQGRARRLLARDSRLGALLMAAIILAWIGTALAVEGRAFVDNIFYKQIYQRAVDSWHHQQPFYHYIVNLPLAFLPWTAILVVLPWRKIRERFKPDILWRAGKDESPAAAFLWSAAASGFVFLSLVSTKIVIYLLPLFPVLALLTGKKLLTLDERNKRRLFATIGGMLLFFCLGLAVAEVFVPYDMKGLALALFILLGTGHILYHYRESDTRALVVALVIGMTLFIQPAAIKVAPAMDKIMSPRDQATVMRSYIDKGYFPASWRIYSGTYTYYAGQNIYETNSPEELEQVLASHDKVVLALRKKDWLKWEGPAGLRQVDEHIIVDRPYVLVVKE